MGSCPMQIVINAANLDAKKSGNGLRVKTQRVKTSENFSEESNLPRRFRRYPEILQNPVKVISGKSSEISSANIVFFREVLRSFYPLRFYPLALSEKSERQRKTAEGQTDPFSRGHPGGFEGIEGFEPAKSKRGREEGDGTENVINCRDACRKVS